MKRPGPKRKVSISEVAVALELKSNGIPYKTSAYYLGVPYTNLCITITKAKKVGFKLWEKAA